MQISFGLLVWKIGKFSLYRSHTKFVNVRERYVIRRCITRNKAWDIVFKKIKAKALIPVKGFWLVNVNTATYQEKYKV